MFASEARVWAVFIYVALADLGLFLGALTMAVAFGIVYLFIEALQIVYGSCGFSIQDRTLAFIPLGIGLLFGVFVRFYDC